MNAVAMAHSASLLEPTTCTDAMLQASRHASAGALTAQIAVAGDLQQGRLAVGDEDPRPAVIGSPGRSVGVQQLPGEDSSAVHPLRRGRPRGGQGGDPDQACRLHGWHDAPQQPQRHVPVLPPRDTDAAARGCHVDRHSAARRHAAEPVVDGRADHLRRQRSRADAAVARSCGPMIHHVDVFHLRRSGARHDGGGVDRHRAPAVPTGAATSRSRRTRRHIR